MKLKINQLGYLNIERNGEYKLSKCPKSFGKNCGDWCCLFGEPEEKSFSICDKKWFYSDEHSLIDDRKLVIKEDVRTDI